MGTDYRLACAECKEFLDLHKWRPHHGLIPDVGMCQGYERFCAAEIGTDEIGDFVRKWSSEASAQWIDELIPRVERFCRQHNDHRIVMFSDQGELPWYPDQPGWHVWKKIGLAASIGAGSPLDVDLPRNIIDDLRIVDWPTARAHYLKYCPDIDDPDAIESVFNYLVANTREAGTP